MPSRQLSPNELQQIRNVAAQWGKIIARRAFGEQGPAPRLISRPWRTSPALPLLDLPKAPAPSCSLSKPTP